MSISYMCVPVLPDLCCRTSELTYVAKVPPETFPLDIVFHRHPVKASQENRWHDQPLMGIHPYLVTHVRSSPLASQTVTTTSQGLVPLAFPCLRHLRSIHPRRRRSYRDMATLTNVPDRMSAARAEEALEIVRPSLRPRRSCSKSRKVTFEKCIKPGRCFLLAPIFTVQFNKPPVRLPSLPTATNINDGSTSRNP